MAMHLISSHKKGISSHQLARDIEVTQKTAWYMLQKVRSLFAQDDSTALEGEVEFMSNVRAMVVEKSDMTTHKPIISQFIKKDTTVKMMAQYIPITLKVFGVISVE